MPDGPRIAVYCEGRDDCTVLVELKNAGLLPSSLDLPKPDPKRGGYAGIVKDFCTAPVRAIMLRDFDDLDVAGVREWFIQSVGREGGLATLEAIPRFTVRIERTDWPAAAVPIGLPGDPMFKDWPTICRHSMDDYVLKLASDEGVWNAVDKLKVHPRDVCFTKAHEIAALLAKNGMPVEKTKSVVHMLRGVAWVAASESWFARRLAQAAGEERLRDLFSPLLKDLEEAARALG
ncbi:MAG: hypothetical protein HY720_07865 [Planctomycetes bacterium]|nr:hypothetical protein [Planctomycetota bacterium]